MATAGCRRHEPDRWFPGTGYGGLDGAVTAAFGAEVVWVADNDPDVCRILDARFPGIRNLGDIREVDWEAVPRVDILTAGFPCQDVSAAGQRAGMQPGNRSGLWLNIVQALAVLRPSIVIVENVRGLLSARAHSDVEPCPVCVGDGPARRLRALGAVLGDLAGLGFDAEWQVVSAADAGSCHKRERVFILAWQAAADPGRGNRNRILVDASRMSDAGRKSPAGPLLPGALSGCFRRPGRRTAPTAAEPARFLRDLALPSAAHRLPLFRTPTSQLAVNGGSQHPDKRKAGGHGPTLADEVEHLLPTPAAGLRRLHEPRR